METVALPDESVVMDVVRVAFPVFPGPRFVPRKSHKPSCAAQRVLGSCPASDGFELSDSDCREEGRDCVGGDVNAFESR